MQTQNVSIISIHADPAQPLAIDLKDLLCVLGPHLEEWIWCVRYLDWLGQDSEAICRQVEAAGPSGLWLSSQELMTHAREVYQTIEGQFLAFPRAIDRSTVEAHELDFGEFPSSRADLAIVAIDGCFFEVFAKDSELLSSYGRFKGVRVENPSAYF